MQAAHFRLQYLFSTSNEATRHASNPNGKLEKGTGSVWSSRLFWKLFFTYAALALAATLAFVMIVSGGQQDRVIRQFKLRLQDSSALVRNDVIDRLSSRRSEELQSLVRRLGQEIETRITLVAMNGDVLADSKQSSLAAVAKMENHKNRLELIQAAKLGEGTSERTSPTLGVPMLYVALRADVDGRPMGLIRTSLPMTDVREQVASMQILIWGVGLTVNLIVVLISYFVAAALVRPILTLTASAEAIASGEYHQQVYFHSNDELGELATSFNRMSEQLKTRETQLREGRQRLATVLEGMAEGVISLDDRQRIVLANVAAGKLLGFTPDDSQGRPLIEVIRNHKLHTALVESQASNESRRVEIELAEGENRALSIYATLVPGERRTRFILVIQDVTDLRRLESMRQEFVANVSHELKTPLSSIKAYAETLSAGAINDAENNLRFVHRIEDQAERLHQLILDLLSLARIESGQQAFDIGVIDVESLVLSCLAEHQGNAESKGIELLADGSGDDAKIRADEEGARQILNNLVNNALNYTEEGGKVTVGWRSEPNSAPGMAILCVSDTGAGIAEQHLPRLFERFYRVDKARSRELGGTGLGLSIVKHLTQSFGGNVEVESELGAGTTFTVRLPLA